MDIFLQILLGCLCIFLGIGLINYYQNLVKQEKHGGLSFKLRTAGIGLIIVGIGLIIKSCN